MDGSAYRPLSAITTRRHGRTYGEHFHLTEVEAVFGERKLHDDVAESQSLLADPGALDAHRGTCGHVTRVLAAQRVVPENRCAGRRAGVAETHHEVVRSVSCK